MVATGLLCCWDTKLARSPGMTLNCSRSSDRAEPLKLALVMAIKSTCPVGQEGRQYPSNLGPSEAKEAKELVSPDADEVVVSDRLCPMALATTSAVGLTKLHIPAPTFLSRVTENMRQGSPMPRRLIAWPCRPELSSQVRAGDMWMTLRWIWHKRPRTTLTDAFVRRR